MIAGFRNQSTEDLFNGVDSKAAHAIPKSIWPVARRKLDLLNAAHDLRDLRVPPGNRLEALKGKPTGYFSIRINDQFRLVFQWAEGNARNVFIVDYHD
jgi:proteic killer suppression protein